MNISLTKDQYNLIREAIEKYYYICKDDSELYHKLDSLNNLEETLIKQK